MGWWRDWVSKRQTRKQDEWQMSEDARFIREIKEAQANWEVAVAKLDYAVDKDQIDYSIFAIEACEKRYEMLLRQAKKRNIRYPDNPGKAGMHS